MSLASPAAVPILSFSCRRSRRINANAIFAKLTDLNTCYMHWSGHTIYVRNRENRHQSAVFKFWWPIFTIPTQQTCNINGMYYLPIKNSVSSMRLPLSRLIWTKKSTYFNVKNGKKLGENMPNFALIRFFRSKR